RRTVTDLHQRRSDLLRGTGQVSGGRLRRCRPAATLGYHLQPGLATGQVTELIGRQLADELGDADQYLVGDVGWLRHTYSLDTGPRDELTGQLLQLILQVIDGGGALRGEHHRHAAVT